MHGPTGPRGVGEGVLEGELSHAAAEGQTDVMMLRSHFDVVMPSNMSGGIFIQQSAMGGAIGGHAMAGHACDDTTR